MWENMLKKVVTGMLLIVPFILVAGCNSGSALSGNDSSANVELLSSNAVTMLANTEISSNSSEDSCLKAVLDQTQISNKLTTSITFNNACNYDTFIGGYKVNFTSEYTDDSKVQLDQLSYAYINTNGNNRNYTLKFTSRQYVCTNGNGAFEMLTGTLGARKVKAGTSIILKNVTTLTGGKTYNLSLAKATFRILSPASVLPNELGISLSDPESFNYALQESNLNKGNDSLSNVPLSKFGLKTILVTNSRCANLESALPTLNLPSKVTIDRLRTTCKIDGTQRLLSQQSCRFVLRYDPMVNDAIQAYESVVNIDVYAKMAGNALIDHSNIFKVPYSTRGKISGAQVINDKLNVLDNQPNGLGNVSIGYFGLKTYTISNISGRPMESLTFVYAPNALGLPLGLNYDLFRTTCKLDGTQSLAAGQSCNLTIKYLSQMQQVAESTLFQAFAYLPNSQKSVVYASNKYLVNYATSNNSTPSIMPITTSSISGFDVDASITGLSFNNSIINIPVGSFGLKAYLLSNDTGQNMYNVNIANINELGSLTTLKIDDTRSTCKFNTTITYNKFSLKDGQSCLLVFKYTPIVSKSSVNYNLMISGYDAGGNKVLSEATPVLAIAR